ncbi:hypothetical protein [Paenibacillus sp. FSL H3-0333]|uniref:hypothetical protein n=1 Tax=Paenibacillus sp. FSL H3-0333 TaxID=2921373 RepID=UPI0030F7134E
MINLFKSNITTKTTNVEKVFGGIIHINNKGDNNMSEVNESEQQISIEDVMQEIGFEKKAIKKAIAIKYELNHFLKTNEDRLKLIQLVKEKQLYPWMRVFFLKVLDLSKEIGSYHYTYDNFSHLEQMPIKNALECLFLEPFNSAKMEVFAETKLTLKQLFDLKALNPNQLFLNLTLCI